MQQGKALEQGPLEVAQVEIEICLSAVQNLLIDLSLFSNSYLRRNRLQTGGKILNMGKEVSVAASSPQQQRWENPERERESARGRERESICYRETLLPPRPLSTVHRIWFQIVFQFRYRPKDKVQNHRIRIKSSYSFDLFAYHNYKNRVFEYI